MSGRSRPYDRPGRADLHLHTVASDGVASVTEILAYVQEATDLDVIAVTDHERVDAAIAARELARRGHYRFEVVVGEEVTTRGGHLLALFLEERVRPLQSLRATIAQIHAQGGLAVPAHALARYYPMSASARSLRGLLADPDPAVHPDALETFNATAAGRAGHERAMAFAAAHDLPVVGGSDAHLLEQIGACWTTFPGRTASDLRAALVAGRTGAEGTFHGSLAQARMVALQYRKHAGDVRDELRGKLLRRGGGRDLGYPGGRRRPAVLELTEDGQAAAEDGA